jgi:hypothetical protein
VALRSSREAGSDLERVEATTAVFKALVARLDGRSSHAPTADLVEVQRQTLEAEAVLETAAQAKVAGTGPGGDS